MQTFNPSPCRTSRSPQIAYTLEIPIVIPRDSAVLTERSSSVSNPWEATSALAFLGFRVLWRRTIGDYDRNIQFARSWEHDFESWSIQQRDIELAAPKKGYFVRLTDGVAHFTTESADGFKEAVEHVPAVLKTLAAEQESPGVLDIVAQFVQPVDDEFDALARHLDEKLVNPLVAKTIGATTLDVAYLVDMEVDGIWRQVNIGPVRAREIPGRLAARIPRQRPAVGIFLSVTSRKSFRHELSDLSALAINTAQIGREILEAIAI